MRVRSDADGTPARHPASFPRRAGVASMSLDTRGSMVRTRSLISAPTIGRRLCLSAAPRVCGRGCAGSDAGIFLHLLEHRTTRRADATRGKFRSFLLVRCGTMCQHDGERHAQKRGGDCEVLSLDDPAAPLRNRLRIQPPIGSTRRAGRRKSCTGR
jgi:hypothetical protein